MKKRLLIVISLILAVMSVLSACVKTPTNSETSGDDSASGEPAALLLNNVDIKEYTLIFNSKSAHESNYFNNTLNDIYGVTLEKATMQLDGYNLFIGVTGSDAAVNSFYNSTEEGMIGYDGKNVYLLTKSSKQLYDVIDAFFAKATDDGRIDVTQNEKVSAPKNSIKVMSYNVLFNKYYDDNQPRDINKLAEFIAAEAPDVFGTQETQPFHKDAILAAMTNYDCYTGIEIEPGEGTHNMIFWNADKFKLVSKGYQYLTATPYVFSKIPESNSYRTLSYVVLESIENHNQFMFVNTHLTYRNAKGAEDDDTPRYKQAQYLKKFLESDKYEKLPIILVGDFNSIPTSNTLALLGKVDRFSRAAVVAQKTGDTGGTCNYKHGTLRDDKYALDHIFVTNDRISTEYFTTLNEESMIQYEYDEEGVKRYLSDHMPVVANITIY